MTVQAAIGDIVHYVSYGTPGGEYAGTCRAAIVTQVVPPAEVEPGVYEDKDALALAVLNPTGIFFNTEVPRTPYVGDVTLGGTWHKVGEHD